MLSTDIPLLLFIRQQHTDQSVHSDQMEANHVGIFRLTTTQLSTLQKQNHNRKNAKAMGTLLLRQKCCQFTMQYFHCS